MLWLPLASEAVEQVAPPAVRATLAQPARALVPSRNATVPVGVPTLPLTDTLKVTLCPVVDGLREEESEAEAADFATTDWLNAAEVAAL